MLFRVDWHRPLVVLVSPQGKVGIIAILQMKSLSQRFGDIPKSQNFMCSETGPEPKPPVLMPLPHLPLALCFWKNREPNTLWPRMHVVDKVH